MESTVDRIEGSKNPEICPLFERKFWCQFVNRVSVGLPCQHQPPRLDSIVQIIFSQGKKFDVLVRIINRTRKDLLDPFVEPLGEGCQVFEGVEFGMLQLLW